MSDWAKHKLVCDKIANDPEKPRKVYLVLSNRGEGQLYAFYKLKKAEKFALENNGDVRRPYGFEEYEDLSKKKSLMMMDMFAGNLPEELKFKMFPELRPGGQVEVAPVERITGADLETVKSTMFMSPDKVELLKRDPTTFLQGLSGINVIHAGGANGTRKSATGDFTGGGRAMAVDHPSYQRPISATKDFFVNGKPSEITIVIACCSGCTLWCASVHFGADASQNAEKEAKDRNSTDDKGVSWVVSKIKVSK